MITLFQDKNPQTQVNHKNIMFSDLSSGSMVQANQHIIIHNNEAIILDPGGHKVYTELFSRVAREIAIGQLKYIFLSHQDPDIVAALNGWFMVTDARALIPGIWARFVTHFGIDDYAAKRIDKIPDQGGVISLGGCELKIIPAHFLHSAGNFQLYDPLSKILYSGDLGSSLGTAYHMVEDFDAHIPYMETFHKRYMPSTRALKTWATTVKKLDIQTMAPQHGALFTSPQLVQRFIDWINNLTVGADLLGDSWDIP